MKPEFPQSSREEQELKITALLMGELSKEEAAKVEEILKADAELAALHEQLKAAFGLVQEAVTQEPDPIRLSQGRREKVLATFRGKETEKTTRASIDWRTWGALAAMVAGLLGVAAVAFRFLWEGSEDRGARADNRSGMNLEWLRSDSSRDQRPSKEMPPRLDSSVSVPQEQRAKITPSTDGYATFTTPLAGDQLNSVVSDAPVMTSVTVQPAEPKSPAWAETGQDSGKRVVANAHIALPAESKPDENGRAETFGRSSFGSRLGSTVNKAAAGPAENGAGGPAASKDLSVVVANPEPGVMAPQQPNNSVWSTSIVGYTSVPSLPAPTTPRPAGVPAAPPEVLAQIGRVLPPPAPVVPPPVVPATESSTSSTMLAGTQAAPAASKPPSGPQSASETPAKVPGISNHLVTDLYQDQVSDGEKKEQKLVLLNGIVTNSFQAANTGVTTFDFVNEGSLGIPMSTNMVAGISGGGGGFGINPNPSLGWNYQYRLSGGMSGQAGFGEKPGASFGNQPGAKSDYQYHRLESDDVGGLRFVIPQQELQKDQLAEGLKQTQRTSTAGGRPQIQRGTELSLGESQLVQQKFAESGERDKSGATGRIGSHGALDLKNADLNQALEKYQELSGRTVVRPQSFPEGKVNLQNIDQLSKEEAVKKLEDVLAQNQITMIPQGTKFTKAVPQSAAPQEGTPFHKPQTVQQKLDDIRFDTLAFDDIPLQEVVKQLSEEAKKKDPEHRGINLLVNSTLTNTTGLPTEVATGLPAQANFAGTDPGTLPVRVGLTNVTLREALQRISASTGQHLDVKVENYGVVISPSETNGANKAESAFPNPTAPTPIPQPEVLTSTNSFSTFSLNVSDVSFKLAGASLEKGTMPEAASIRSEEFVNAFDYHDPEPAGSAPIAFNWERARYPFAYGRDLLRFSVKTAAVGRQAGRPLNLVLLLDNSGSMERADRVQIRMECLRVLAGQLQPQDRVSVVAFARTARLWVDGLAGNQAGDLATRVGTLNPEGGTNLEEAMNLAYQTALKHFLPSGMNRVVLLTDGAANLGDVQPESLKKKVEAFRKQGVALDCFGIGWEGFNDDLLEVLSRNGDGRYGFVNTPDAAKTEFANQLAGALKVAASDVKVQVEFNPQRATAYRQIGYAKHQLTKEQFRDNTVDAAEIGAAEAGNALYVVDVNPKGEGPIATVRVRFKVPGTTDYREHAWAVPYEGEAKNLAQSTATLRLAGVASAFSEWLASSPYAGEVTTDRLLNLLSGVPETFGADPRPKRLEWMLRQAKSISGK